LLRLKAHEKIQTYHDIVPEHLSERRGEERAGEEGRREERREGEETSTAAITTT